MEGTFLFNVIPQALRNALVADGMPAVDLVQEVLRHAFESDDLEMTSDARNMEDLAMTISNTLIAALNPLAQRLMESMTPPERMAVMAWLSDPTPIATAMRSLMETLLGESDQARAFAESAIEVASNVPEVAAMLQQEGGQMPPPSEVLYELQQLRDGKGARPAVPLAERREKRQLAERVAADAAFTAANAAADASVSGVPPAHRRRSSERLGKLRKSCPLLVLDEDCLRLVLQGLPPDAHAALECTSRGWRAAVRHLHAGRAWQGDFGCLYSTSLIKVLSESGKARLDVGPEGTYPRPACRSTDVREQPKRASSAASSATSSAASLATSSATSGKAPMPPPPREPLVGGLQGLWTRLVVRRLDGPSVGLISSQHVVGIYTESGTHRLDLARALNPQPTGHESAGTRLRLQPAPFVHGAGSSSATAASSSSSAAEAAAADAPLRYGRAYSLVSDCGTYTLNLGLRNTPVLVRASDDVWSTRLQLRVIDSVVDEAAGTDAQSQGPTVAARAARAAAQALQASVDAGHGLFWDGD